MDSVYKEWVGGRGGVGGEGGWGDEGGLLVQKSSHCVFIEVHRQQQFTFQAATVADSSFTPSVALLVHPRGTTHSIVTCHEFTGS